jgi:hypothetical protein
MKRSYSRRELYALGEPLGDSATYRKVGGLVLGDGGGGGGSAPPPDKQTTVTELPEWARPYAKDVLAKGAALTDINQNPYQTYGANRIAGFSPLQQMSFQGAANMQPSQQLGTGTDLATAAGIGALGTNYQAGRFGGGMFGQDAADFYMNPYQQNVTDIGKREAARQSQIQGTQQQAQATQAGAFGGSRDAIMRAERERNLGQQMSDIQAQGSNAAFTNAQQQFNADQARRMQAQQLGEQSRQYGAGLGMQGLQTALQSAGQLGQLGGQQFQQGMDINKLQSAYGGQMQQQAQRPLDQAYQDFLNQQNYPYKQLGFMSDMIRGLPLGQKSTSSVYEQGPGMVQTLAGLGGAAYGFGKSGLFGKEGGLMTSYAEGGDVKTYAGDEGSVTSQQNVEGILNKLSDQQLQQAKESALNRRDVEQANMIDAEMAERASIRGGLGGAFNQIPEERQEEMMAGGGIVAFAPGGTTYLDKAEEARKQQMDYINQATTQQTPEEQKTNVLAQREVMKDLYGPSITPKYLEEVKAERTALPEKMESDKGLAFAMASLKLLSRKKTKGESQGQQLISGLGEAGEAFVGEVGRLKKEHKEADRLLRQSEIQLATADQLYNNGLTDKAVAKADQAQASKARAAELHAGVAGKTAEMYVQLENTDLGKKAAIRAAEISAGASERSARISAAKETDLHRQTRIRFAALVKQGKPADEQTMAEAAGMAAGDLGKYSGVDRAADARAAFYDKISDNVDAGLLMDRKYRELQKEDKKTNGNAAQQYREQRIAVEVDKARSQGQPTQGQPAPNAPAQQQAAPTAVPTLNEFLAAAKKVNQGVPDADLIKYYNNKYGR